LLGNGHIVEILFALNVVYTHKLHRKSGERLNEAQRMLGHQLGNLPDKSGLGIARSPSAILTHPAAIRFDPQTNR
jgi:hypothetical protein